METKGCHVFARNENVPPADVLNKVLVASHKVLKQEKVIQRVRPVDRTWLIHPSPVSEVALDFIFETEKCVFSPFSSNLFLHLNCLKGAFSLYVLGDLLFSLENNYPQLFPSWSLEISSSFLASVADTSTQQLIAIVDEVNFIARVEQLADKFDQAVRIFLCLGVVPVSRDENYDIAFAPVIGNVSDYIETYVSFLETTINTFSVISTKALARDTVLTERGGTYGCTDYEGVPYVLWSFGRVPTYCKTGYTARPPLISMMQYEFQYMFANTKHRHQAIEKMTKTSVVVSSVLTDEAEAILDTNRRKSSIDSFKPSEAIQSIEKEREKLDILAIKAQTIRKAANGVLPEHEPNFKQQLAALEAAVNINDVLEKSLRKHLNKPKSTTSKYLIREDDYFSGIAQEHGMIHGAGPEKRKKEIKETSRIVQEKILLQKNRKLHTELAENQKETAVLRDELVSMIQNQAKLDFQLKLKQTNIDVAKKQLDDVTKERDKTTMMVKKYEELIENMKETVDKALTETNAGAADRNRLLKMFAHAEFCDASGQCVDTKYEFSQNNKCLVEFFNLILGRHNAKKEQQKNTDLKDNDKTDYAYETMLKEHGVYVVPFFTGIQNQTTLDVCNYWLPHEWMHDKPLEPPSKDGLKMIDCTGRQAVTNTPELYMLDVNPKTTDETLRIKRAIEAVNGTTLFDSVFQRNFLNVQFPVQGSVEGSINAHLKEKWHHVIGKLLLLSGETFTKNGQKIGARVSSASINFFISPFLAQYLGREGHRKRLPTFVATFLDKTATEVEETGFAPYEKMIYSFCRRRISLAHLSEIHEGIIKKHDTQTFLNR